MLSFRSAGLISAIAASLACSARQAPVESTPVAVLGRYSFLAEAKEGLRLTGTLTVTRDTILAQPSGTTCRVAPTQPSSLHLVYECPVPGMTGVVLTIDRRNPLRRSTWAALVPVRRTREVCIAFRTWENGRRTCTRTQSEEYTEQVRRVGELVVTR